MWNGRMLIMAAGLALAGAGVPQSVDALQAGRARAEGSERARAERARAEGSERARAERARTERARAERDRQERERYERGRYEREGRATARRNNGNGPPFCRDGRGHPVHGRRWCTEKGYGLGNDRYDRRDDRYDPWDRRDDRWDRDWERVRWDVAFYNPRYRQSRLSRNELTDLLGRRSYDRFDEHRRRTGLSGSLLGMWSVTQRGYGLQLLAGGRPLALLVDGNRDGRVDEIYLVRR